MKRNVLTSLLLGLGMLVLAACSTGEGGPGGDGPPLPERTDLDPAGETSATHTGNLTVGETDYFVLDPNSLSGDLIVVELDQELLLEQTTITGATIMASSSGPEYFEAGDFAPASAAELDPAAIGVEPPLCRGSCIVLAASNETLYFEVSGAQLPTEYSIYVYGADHVDTNEPINDSEITAPGYFLDDDGGAIETIGDVDWWQVAGTETSSTRVEFLATGPLDLQVYVVTALGESDPYVSGDVIDLLPGDLLRVESATDRAGRGAPSFYYFSPVTIAGAGNAQ